MELTPEQLEHIKTAFRLSPKEFGVLRLLMVRPASNAEIAEELKTTEGAVKSTTRTLLLKMGLRSRHQLSLAIAVGLYEATIQLRLREIEALRAAKRES